MKFKISTVKWETDCDHFFEKEQKKCSLYSFASLCIENSPATNWQRWKKKMARVISTNFWDKNVSIVFVEL